MSSSRLREWQDRAQYIEDAMRAVLVDMRVLEEKPALADAVSHFLNVCFNEALRLTRTVHQSDVVRGSAPGARRGCQAVACFKGITDRTRMLCKTHRSRFYSLGSPDLGDFLAWLDDGADPDDVPPPTPPHFARRGLYRLEP